MAAVLTGQAATWAAAWGVGNGQRAAAGEGASGL